MKRGIMEQDGPRARPGFRRINRATRWAGTVLCWTHATAMLLTATEVLLRPSADWWPITWSTAWSTTGALLIVWAILRTSQKQRLRQIAQPEGADGASPENGPVYDQAA
ncbi:hypothetical protein ACIQNG_26290 [Streptomyces sp. NPDC091377]|uniref:hypothetical protein n=1 Tax=Streptomyces sp. NPDC091377 TaxID=3365995 RepID=UPI003810A942